MIKLNKQFIGYSILISVCLAIAFFINKWILSTIINSQIQKGMQVVTLNPLETINLILTGTIIIGIILLTPLILYKIYKYYEDAMYDKEKKIIKQMKNTLILPITGFIFGLAITHFIIIPFLITIMNSYKIANIIAISQIIKLYLINGLIMAGIFIMPVIIKILNKLKIVFKEDLKNKRNIIYMISVVLLAVITPTTDAITLIIIMTPIIIMYELSIIITTKRNKYGIIIQ